MSISVLWEDSTRTFESYKEEIEEYHTKYDVHVGQFETVEYICNKLVNDKTTTAMGFSMFLLNILFLNLLLIILTTI